MGAPAATAALDDLGRTLREARARTGESQAHLARRLGIAQSYLSELERGPSIPGPALLMAVARALDLDATVLLLAAAARDTSARDAKPAACAAEA